MSDGVTVMQAIARTEVEDFLFAEAELLDEWRLPEWLELFTDDAIYYVPATDLAVDASPDNNPSPAARSSRSPSGTWSPRRRGHPNVRRSRRPWTR